ncbi:adenylyl-sulfate kinase [Desulfonatronum thioautotrophicum]|uniref:adenylyl-sulfate kinase n=1 Tax=Desulfonatronum thioautotrophicum TaxID=617001 RepID=UPI00069C6D35|nr:adenylyl-sulfate kinase [Desulfonatronum thioautotrophicum]
MSRDDQAYPPVSIAAKGCQNVVAYRGEVRRENREKLPGQTSMVMWFTGLSGSGKSTIAHAVEDRLHAMGRLTYVFDGGDVHRGRQGLSLPMDKLKNRSVLLKSFGL